MISSGIFSVPMRKLSKLLCVWAPQYRSAGTRISPMESCSFLYSIFLSSGYFCEKKKRLQDTEPLLLALILNYGTVQHPRLGMRCIPRCRWSESLRALATWEK